ncbi:MAG TPA: ABC transporter substrate-binding protein [bacterium]|nr:ABC transporter substrate-binding protein [bacterium]
MNPRRYPLIAVSVIMLGASLSSCQKSQSGLRIAEQFGLAYAPVTIARQLGFMDEALKEAGLPDKVEWLRLANTATIREAALAGNVDAAFMGIPPYLISKAGGMTWRIAAGLNQSPNALVSGSARIQNLDDFKPEDRIVLPQPGSIQHILLAMGAQRLLGDAKRFDNQLVTMSHPDGMQALLAGKEIVAHFTSSPYLALELKQPGIHQILDGRTCFGGPYTFIVTVATDKLAQTRPRVYRAFMAGLRKGIDYVREHPEESARILAPLYSMDVETVMALLGEQGNEYGTTVLGLGRFVDFMKETGYLPEKFSYGDDLYWDPAVARGDVRQ